MRILFCLSSKPNKNTMNVCLRNLQSLIDGLSLRGHEVAWWSIASDPDKGTLMKRAQHKGKKWDVICCVYATRFVHMDYVDQLLAENPQAKLGWWSTEYDITRPYGFKDLDFVLLNFEESFYAGRKKFYKKALVTNYNALVADATGPIRKKVSGSIYYGRYRPDRAKYFRKYLNSGKVMLSTSDRNVKNYYREGIRGQILDKMDWTPGKETLSLFVSSLYIEDETTHKIYNHPASRWYEGIRAGTYPVVDVSCRRTMQMAGIELPDTLWLDGPDDIERAHFWIESQKKNSKWWMRWSEQALAERGRCVKETSDFIESL